MARLPAFAVEGAMATGRLLRTVAYAATAGQTGIISPDSWKVTANGAAVQIAAGSAVAATRYVSSPSYNSYVLVSDSAESVSIPATGSGSGATRYIIARVDDPEHGGQADPTKTYWSFAQVGSITALPYPFVPLAKITQPASTSTITQAMIEDLRSIAVPRRRRELELVKCAAVTNLTSSTYIDYPSDGGVTVDVPLWATRAIVKSDLLEVLLAGGNSDGHLTMTLGNQPAYTTERRYDEVYGGSTSRIDLAVASSFQITPEMRGTSQRLRLRGRRSGGSGNLRADSYTQVVWDYEFIEAPA